MNRIPRSIPFHRSRFFRDNGVTRCLFVLLMVQSALIMTFPAPSFLIEYQSFLNALRERIPQTHTSADFQQLMNWKNQRITQILRLAPTPDGRDATAWYAMGHLLQLRGTLPEAIHHMQESLRRDDANVSAAKALLNLFLQTDQPREAGRLLRQYRTKIPPGESGALCLAVAQSFFEQADYLAANDYLELARLSFSRDHQTRRLTGMICQNFALAGEKKKALEYLSARERERPAEQSSLRDLRRHVGLLHTPAPELDVEHWLDHPAPNIAGGQGRVTLIDFWAPGCPDCLDSMTEIKPLHDAYQAAGLDIISLCTLPESDSSATGAGGNEPAAFLSRLHTMREARGWSWSFGVAATGSNHERFAVTTIPHVVLMDKQGNIRFMDHGKMLDFPRLQATIDHLLAEK
ncbi:MAG: TlpA family protein disulfide reductase [Acidobacteria bacterium]|nr:TlpA family protein disulfide reductase [Acidobacteriota bacterium]